MYNVGQVLWLVMNSTRSVTPVQVISKVTQENLKGETVQHIVCDPTGDEYYIEKFDGKVFQSANDAEVYLLKIVSTLIKKLIENAQQEARIFQRLNDHDQTAKVDELLEVRSEDDRPIVTLADGTLARVTLPEMLK